MTKQEAVLVVFNEGREERVTKGNARRLGRALASLGVLGSDLRETASRMEVTNGPDLAAYDEVEKGFHLEHADMLKALVEEHAV